ncbi:MAG TPA: hypothetical protein VH643_27730 [Gemmataceae bacterium]|jgi:hypothetical protein
MADDVEQKKESKGRTRSPAYPAIGLDEAIRRAQALYDAADQRWENIEAAAEHWGYATSSSAFLLTVAALKQFGLLTDEGRREDRRVRLSDLALDIVVHPEDSRERAEAIQKAALNPKIHRELWERFEGKLPSTDVSIRVYLLREREDARFNKDRVDAFISQFRSTIAFARLDQSDTMGSGVPNTKAPASHPESGESRFNRGTRTVCAARSHVTGTAAAPASGMVVKPPMQTGIKEDVYTLDQGQVVVLWPEKIDSGEIADVEDWMQLVIRKMKRSAQRNDPNEPSA